MSAVERSRELDVIRLGGMNCVILPGGREACSVNTATLCERKLLFRVGMDDLKNVGQLPITSKNKLNEKWQLFVVMFGPEAIPEI